MKNCGFAEVEIERVFDLVAAILKAGNVTFAAEDEDAAARITEFTGNTPLFLSYFMAT